ncbi:MAG: His/Gly/Thr/Pro-type tRNA ligase C-terminal domain-containing protein, partial [Verrucomicrobia bacterium]|nr:His/Gly/Thr/Pro-type tRNA ligase C-terminal domain-containing protein [Verrucomicrobiota bacterium]
RALLGSLERFFGILIEHYAGAFPLWLSPEQVRVLPLTENQLAYGESIVASLKDAGIRATLDEKSEKVGGKIRRAQQDKIPYMLVVGPKEAETGDVAVRARTGGDQGAMGRDAFIEKVIAETKTKG